MASDYDFPGDGGLVGASLPSKYAIEKAQAQTAQFREPTLRERVDVDLERARAHVARLEELAKLIDANPSTARILELMGQR